jgi:molybdopterin molybdotransferase
VQERISLNEARAIIVAALAGKTPAIERVSSADVTALLGRTLADSLRAPFALPPFANSAMDGYALRFADLSADVQCLPLQGSALAGAKTLHLQAGHCVRITTGAALPIGADTVIMQEQTLQVGASDQGVTPDVCPSRQGVTPYIGTSRQGVTSYIGTSRQGVTHYVDPSRQGVTPPHGELVQFLQATKLGAFVRQAGEDFQENQLVMRAGTQLGPAQIALLHAFGITELRVYARPKVIVLAGGDELRPTGEALAYGQIYECNRASLCALLSALGAHVIAAPVMPDQKTAIRHALLQAAASADLVLSTGGASVGDADFLPQLLGELGHVHFYKVRAKPGMPALFAQVNACPVLALPGNPVSVFISFLTLAKPAVELLCGREPSELEAFYLPLTSALKKTHARREFLRATVLRQHGAEPQLQVLEGQGSAMLRGLLHADGVIDLPEGECELAAGTRVAYLPFRGLLG